MKGKKIILILCILAVLSVGAYAVYYSLSSKGVSGQNAKSTESVYTEDNVKSISDIESVAKNEENIKDVDFTGASNVEVTLDKTYEITKGGVYTFTGKIEDGYIHVKTDENVKIVLKGVSIKNSKGPAIYIESAKNAFIELYEGTENYLEDGSTYAENEENMDAVIYSKDDLAFLGTGKLTIKANYKDAIASKDDLKIENGTYIITAKDDGIRGKDSVVITSGNFDITSGGDGIKSTNDTDTSKGYILISNGTFKITSESDGISAKTDITIKDGEFNITSGGGSEKATSVKSQDNFRNFKVNTESTSTQDETSAKGIKAGNNVIIETIKLNIDSKDDAIHSNGYVGIKNGTIKILSGDDGIHADAKLIIDDGKVDISKSYEGLEAENITINGGDISITSSDDGINVAGGAGSSDMFKGPQNTQNSTTLLTINGGNIYVNAGGDGLDSNGSIAVNGGNTVVNGPLNDGNGALDYDNTCTVNGGILITSGSSGMAMNISTGSKQASVMFNNISINEGDIITIKDSSGNELLTYSASKKYTSLLYTSSSLKENEKYTLYTNVKTSAKEKNGVYELGGYISGTESTSVNATTGSNSQGGFGGMMGPNENRNMMPENLNDVPQGGNFERREMRNKNM